MKKRIATTALVIGALALPIAGFAQTATPPAKAPDQATGTKETVKDAVKDSMITAKIKAEFMKDPAVSALAIKVDTDDKGVVQLSGTAKSQAEADKAVQIAKATQGVTNVKNDIKIAP